ncbi:TetR family transcriptional regulator [Rhodoferax koreense]|uniref:TetR family transcriptional regulator n=1 Tax=Rhodoferax koreensis TaxID=1842727 RepID=A0A1P8K2R7_9BURK|nr:TetR/AcrR family transcriptional regulator [Rhodoferax koreense]APW40305.1 TetR family transcriptional regulator [Rhodoferax koreense]
MKVSKEQMAENRERILDTAAKLFRERGFDGIGVADLMKAAGFTHGGFYGHFASKEDLMAQSSARALANGLAYWENLAEQVKDEPLAALQARYLSTKHRDHPGAGCLMAALGAETARQGAPVRQAVTEGVRSMAGLLARLMPGRSKAVRQQKALAAYASMVGALVLARAVDDPALSEEILQATAASLGVPPPASVPSAR